MVTRQDPNTPETSVEPSQHSLTAGAPTSPPMVPQPSFPENESHDTSSPASDPSPLQHSKSLQEASALNRSQNKASATRENSTNATTPASMSSPESPSQAASQEIASQHSAEAPVLQQEANVASSKPRGEEGGTPSFPILIEGPQRLERMSQEERESYKANLIRHSWTAMPEKLGLFWGWFSRRMFSSIELSSERVQEVKEAAEQGTVVYVLHSHSYLKYLIYNHLFERYELPVSHFAQGLVWLPWKSVSTQIRTFFSWVGRLFGGGGKDGATLFREMVDAEHTTLLFLQSPETLYTRVRRAFYTCRDWFRKRFSMSEAPGGRNTDIKETLEYLVKLQRKQDKPIFLIPEVLVWDRTPPRARRTFLDALFGEQEFPGFWRELYLFIRDRRRSQVRGGSPINLQEFMHEVEDLGDAYVARKLRWKLRDRLYREYRVVTGPVKRSPEEMNALVMRSPQLQACIRKEAEALGVPRAKVEKRAQKMLSRMAAVPSLNVARWVDWTLVKVWQRIYQGINVNEEGLERVRKAALDAPIIFIPSHKSHIDYLVISQILHGYDLMLPHIAAGDNLNVPIIGWIFRRCGAFFIRRSFGDDTLYKTLCTEYIKRLLREGHHIEFFIEGGRSRTGKLRRPKMGMLSMVANNVLDKRVRDIYIVPVAINYEQIIEGESYSRELLGNKKTKESLTGLFRARKLLNLNFGRIHVMFSEPISLKAYTAQLQEAEQGYNPGYDPYGNEEDRRHMVGALSYKVVHEINEVTVTSPSALLSTILLTSQRRGLSRTELIRKVEWLRDEILQRGGKVIFFENTGELVDRAVTGLSKMVKCPKDTLEPIYRAHESRRLELAYYRNQVIHLFLSEGVVACALRASYQERELSEAIDKQHLLHDVRFLSHLLKLEFIYKPSPDIQDNFEHTLEQMARNEMLTVKHSQIRITPHSREVLTFLYALFLPFIDSYWAAALALFSLDGEEATTAKVLTAHMQKIAQTLYHEGHLRYSDVVSMDTMQTALEWFETSKIIVRETEVNGKRVSRRDQGLRLHQNWKDLKQRKQFVESIGRFSSCESHFTVMAKMIALQQVEEKHGD